MAELEKLEEGDSKADATAGRAVDFGRFDGRRCGYCREALGYYRAPN
jgi:hypothetical protein